MKKKSTRYDLQNAPLQVHHRPTMFCDASVAVQQIPHQLKLELAYYSHFTVHSLFSASHMACVHWRQKPRHCYWEPSWLLH